MARQGGGWRDEKRDERRDERRGERRAESQLEREYRSASTVFDRLGTRPVPLPSPRPQQLHRRQPDPPKDPLRQTGRLGSSVGQVAYGDHWVSPWDRDPLRARPPPQDRSDLPRSRHQDPPRDRPPPREHREHSDRAWSRHRDPPRDRPPPRDHREIEAGLRAWQPPPRPQQSTSCGTVTAPTVSRLSAQRAAPACSATAGGGTATTGCMWERCGAASSAPCGSSTARSNCGSSTARSNSERADASAEGAPADGAPAPGSSTGGSDPGGDDDDIEITAHKSCLVHPATGPSPPRSLYAHPSPTSPTMSNTIPLSLLSPHHVQHNPTITLITSPSVHPIKPHSCDTP